MKNNSTLMIVMALIIGLGGGFFGGMQYQGGKQSSLSQQTGSSQYGGRTGSSSGFRGRAGMGQTIGTILSQDDKSITVKLQDGSSKIVLLSSKTTYGQMTQASASDLKVGERVGVFGTSNSDGSVTAQSVQLNPTVRGGGK
jgi:hypothetical protein